MAYGPKRIRRQRHGKAMNLIANAMLAGMRYEKHATKSHTWQGESHTVYSCTIEGILIYRCSLAALARIWMELLPPTGPEKAA